ncbi:MAG: CarD family transcriptional regulator [Deltaproteobacteria bacterium]|jgi:CarD family transcriptional regulator|nr:CarD family transcriptional regulator [Deltaproteobacteria bacterium]
MELELKVGDLIVYPAHGVGRVESIEDEKKPDGGHHFVKIRILDNGMQIMIPSRNVTEVGLRPLISKNDVSGLYKQLKTPPIFAEASNWNRRHRHYLDKLKTGAISDVCDVLRELMTMRGEKELSFGERKLLDTARSLLIKEVAMVTSREEAGVSEELDSFFPPPKATSA